MTKKYYLIPALILLLIAALLSPLAFGFGKTGKNTQILGKDYSLLTKKEIIKKLDSDFILPSELTLVHDNRQFSLSLASISAQLNHDQIANNLLFRRLSQGLPKYIRGFFDPKTFTLEYSYDSAALDDNLNQITSQIDRPFVPYEMNYEKNITVKPGQIGSKVNFDSLKSQILSSLSGYQFQPIDITVEAVGSFPTDDQIKSTQSKAQNLLGKSLRLTAPDQAISLDDKTLISWLNFDSDCRLDKITNYVDGLKTSLKKDPVDAVFKYENNKVTDFRPSSSGYTLNDQNLSGLICGRFSELLASDQKNINLDLPLITTEPKVKTSDVNDLGIKDLLGEGSSTFSHSSEIRNYNVEKGASIVNRILVAPGDTFSFIKNLGDVTLEAGYKKAYIIRQGRTVLDVGGGICQVSTTLFRAMLNSGLDVRDRQNHAYRVSYYEEDMPPGYDATVFIPKPDLTFVNDTGHYVLIQNTYFAKEKRLTYQIYGTSDGRKTEISNYRKWDATPPPPDVYIDDPTLPPGKVIQDEQRIPGLKTAFDWKVTRNGEIIHQRTFQSSYVPWAAVFRRGPTI